MYMHMHMYFLVNTIIRYCTVQYVNRWIDIVQYPKTVCTHGWVEYMQRCTSGQKQTQNFLHNAKHTYVCAGPMGDSSSDHVRHHWGEISEQAFSMAEVTLLQRFDFG